jgi:hypothetical protein
MPVSILIAITVYQFNLELPQANTAPAIIVPSSFPAAVK